MVRVHVVGVGVNSPEIMFVGLTGVNPVTYTTQVSKTTVFGKKGPDVALRRRLDLLCTNWEVKVLFENEI